MTPALFTNKRLILPALARKFFRIVSHPVFVFIALQIICITVTVLWVLWYSQSQTLIEISQSLGRQAIDMNFSLVLLVVGCVLLGCLLVGTVFLFIFAQRKAHLIKQQHNFVSSVTHELRSPLASIQLSFETLTARELPKTIAERIHSMILSDIARLSKLVDQILVSAKLDRGIFAPEAKEPINVTQLIQNVVQHLTYLDTNISRRTVVNCPNNLELTAIKPLVRLIINNLIENAIKYSPLESPIEVSATVENRQVLFAVKDKGMGVNKGDLRRIFRMFHRSETAAKQAIAGTGLGLFIVKSATASLGGKAWVESPGVGLGATFFVSLPVQTT